MRSDQELLIATKAFAQDSPARSWWYVLSTLLILGVALAAAAFAPIPWPFRLGISIFAGLVQCRMFVLYHDYRHGAILRTSGIAHAVMTVFGLLSITPGSSWSDTHDHHHKHHGEIDEHAVGSFGVMTIAEYDAAPWMRKVYYQIQRHWLVILSAYLFVFLWRFCLYPFITNPRKHWDCGLAFVMHAAIATALFWYSPSAMILGLILPAAVGSALGTYLFYVQHNFPAADLREPEEWEYVPAGLHASSYLDTNPFMHWVTANIGYHHVHHLNHRIPFYRLPEAMKAMPELQCAAITTLHPLEIIRCLRLSLWDESTGRLVTARQARRVRKASQAARSAPIWEAKIPPNPMLAKLKVAEAVVVIAPAEVSPTP